MSFGELFFKKIKFDPIDIHADIAHKLKCLHHNHPPRIVSKTNKIIIFGGFENANIQHA